MKKIKKLVLSKETLRNLSSKDLHGVKGGGITSGCPDTGTCRCESYIVVCISYATEC